MVALFLGCNASVPDSATPEFCGHREIVLVDETSGSGLDDTVDRTTSAVAADFDLDGDIDLYLAQLKDPDRVYWNDGTGHFTAEVLPDLLYSSSAMGADIDADGDTDVLVMCGGFMTTCTNHLLRNDGGTFIDISAESGVGRVAGSYLGGAWLDANADGLLDVFIAAKSLKQSWGPNGPTPDGGYWDTPPPEPDLEASANLLLLNRGDGTFEDAAATFGVEDRSNVQFPSALDWNEDGLPDLFTPRFPQTNVLYENRGDHFAVVTPEPVVGPSHSFASGAVDFNDDGHMDLFVAAHTGADFGIAFEPNTVVTGRHGAWTDVASKLGLTDEGLVNSLTFADLDLDGRPDLALGTGTGQPGGHLVDLFYWGEADGFVASDVLGDEARHTNALLVTDLDGDGDQDVFIGTGGLYDDAGAENRLLMNRADCTPGRISLELDEPAVIRVTSGSWTRTVNHHMGSSFTSVPETAVVGTGQQTGPFEVEVTWQDRSVTTATAQPGETLRLR